MTTGSKMCPIHLYERNLCSARCFEARAAFKRSSHGLRVYWYHRRIGQKPMSLAEYRARFEQRVRA